MGINKKKLIQLYLEQKLGEDYKTVSYEELEKLALDYAGGNE